MPTVFDPPSTSTHATTMMSESENSEYSSGVGPGSPQQASGASNHSNLTSYSQPHHDGTSDASAAPAFLDRDEAHAVPNPQSLPQPQEGSGPTSNMEADEYDTPSDTGDDASRDSDSHEGEHNSSFTPPRQGLVKPQAQQDGWVESISRGPVSTATASVSESGSFPLSCVER
jgi:hypothetical protein